MTDSPPLDRIQLTIPADGRAYAAAKFRIAAAELGDERSPLIDRVRAVLREIEPVFASDIPSTAQPDFHRLKALVSRGRWLNVWPLWTPRADGDLLEVAELIRRLAAGATHTVPPLPSPVREDGALLDAAGEPFLLDQSRLAEAPTSDPAAGPDRTGPEAR